MTELICGNCGKTFKRPNQRGPIPRWCSPACRQAAHRVRIETGGGHDMTLGWFDEHGGLWLVCECGQEFFLGTEPKLLDAITVGRQHLHP